MLLINPFKTSGSTAPSVGLTADSKDSVNQFTYPQYLARLYAGISGVYTQLTSLLARAGQTPFVVTATAVTRPADTTAYASGDLVANSTTAGSVTPISLTVARIASGLGQIRRVRLKKSGTTATNASFRVHLFSTAPTVANGDNGVFSASNAGYLGAFDLTMIAFTDSCQGQGAPLAGTEVTFAAAAYGVLIYALIEARAAYTPASAETFTLTLEGLQA